MNKQFFSYADFIVEVQVGPNTTKQVVNPEKLLRIIQDLARRCGELEDEVGRLKKVQP